LEQLVTSRLVESKNIVANFQQALDNLSTSWEPALQTHPDNKLLKKHWYKSVAGLLQVVRF
jgi:hypothetical protein